MVRDVSICSRLASELWIATESRHRLFDQAVVIADESRVRFLVEARPRTCQFTRSRWKKPNLERFLQALNGRFLCFAPISYVSRQKSSNIHAIYYDKKVERAILGKLTEGYLEIKRLKRAVYFLAIVLFISLCIIFHDFLYYLLFSPIQFGQYIIGLYQKSPAANQLEFILAAFSFVTGTVGFFIGKHKGK